MSSREMADHVAIMYEVVGFVFVLTKLGIMQVPRRGCLAEL